MSLINKVAIVTGASSGIGAAIAVKLSEAGAQVAIVGRNETNLKDTSLKCESSGSKPLIIVADVTKETDAKRIISETVQFFGKLDILVNNAGVANYASVADEDAMKVFDTVFSVNLRAAVQMTNLAVEHLTLTKGNIVNISSTASEVVLFRSGSAYCSSKAGLDHFIRAAALDLSTREIRVNGINPGPVKTFIFENTGINPEFSSEFYKLMKQSTVFNRFVDAQEIGDLVVFIASDKARSITGSNIFIDNGSHLTGPIDSHLYSKL